MPANPWELRADVRPLEVAAQRWDDLAAFMEHRAQELVVAAQRATEGWDAAAAESYDTHRRAVVANVDRFTVLAQQVAWSLRSVVSIIGSSQKELDQAWSAVALVPHEVVGESRHLVFRPDRDEDRGLVSRAESGAEEIRGRLTIGLDQESARLRATRAELLQVHTDLRTLDSTGFPASLLPGGELSGVGMVATSSTSVPGSAQGGAAAASLPPIAPLDVSVPDLTGLSSADLGPLGAAAAGGLLGAARRARASTPTTAQPQVGGMGAGAMGARAGSTTRGPAGGGGRAGARRLATPRLEGADGDDARAARAAREKETGKATGREAGRDVGKDSEREAEREAKRAAVEEKRAEREARRVERAARRGRRDDEQDRVHDDERAQDEAYDDGVPAERHVEGERGDRTDQRVPGDDAGRARR